MTARDDENRDNEKLAKAKAAVDYYKGKENEAIRALAEARESLRAAREKHGDLFKECEDRAVARRKSGSIVNLIGY